MRPFEKDQGFVAIIKIFARTWPFLRTYVLWLLARVSRQRVDRVRTVRTTPAGVMRMCRRWSRCLRLLGPATGLVPYGETWLYDFLIVSAGILAVLSWGLLFAKGRLYGLLSAALAITLQRLACCLPCLRSTARSTIVYMFFVVSRLCLHLGAAVSARGWPQSDFRLRLGSHLVYYFVLVWASSLLLLLIALFSVDVISQSILQAKPLTPFIADLISKPEMAAEIPESDESANGANIEQQQLSDEQTTSVEMGLRCIPADWLVYPTAGNAVVAVLLRLHHAAGESGPAGRPARAMAPVIIALSQQSSCRRFRVSALPGQRPGHRRHRRDNPGVAGDHYLPYGHPVLVCARPDSGRRWRS